jgi:hypothetical protein
MALSETAKAALAACFATRGKHKGKLLAKCPLSTTPAAAAWQGAMAVVNPYKLGIGTLLFMTDAQRAIFEEVEAHFKSMPRDYANGSDRDREALERLGVW